MKHQICVSAWLLREKIHKQTPSNTFDCKANMSAYKYIGIPFHDNFRFHKHLMDSIYILQFMLLDMLIS